MSAIVKIDIVLYSAGSKLKTQSRECYICFNALAVPCSQEIKQVFIPYNQIN